MTFKESLYYISIGVIEFPIMGAILAIFNLHFRLKLKKDRVLIRVHFIFLAFWLSGLDQKLISKLYLAFLI